MFFFLYWFFLILFYLYDIRNDKTKKGVGLVLFLTNLIYFLFYDIIKDKSWYKRVS